MTGRPPCARLEPTTPQANSDVFAADRPVAGPVRPAPALVAAQACRWRARRGGGCGPHRHADRLATPGHACPVACRAAGLRDSGASLARAHRLGPGSAVAFPARSETP